MPQKVKYLKRYNENGRQLCVGNDNTCPNLAGYKQTVRGIRKYHNECDKHRRHFHNNLKSKWSHRPSFIVLKKCANCPSKAKHRHRVSRELGYIKNNVITLCKPCHINAHK